MVELDLGSWLAFLAGKRGELVVWTLRGTVLVTLMVLKIYLHINTTQSLNEKKWNCPKAQAPCCCDGQRLQC